MISFLFIIFFHFQASFLKLFIVSNFLFMTNLRFNRETKTSAFFRDDVVKRDRKSRVKIDKNKISAFRDSSMRDSRSSRDSVSESESQSEFQSQFEFVVDSFIVASVAFVAFVAFVASIAFVVSIVSASIDNATLLKMLLQLLFSSFETNFFAIDSVAILVTNSFSIDSITTFVAFVIISIVILEMIEIVDDSNMKNIDVLLKKYDRAQTKLFRSDLDVHDQNRVQKKIQIYVNVSSLNFFVFARFIRVASSDIISRISRISIKRRFRILIVSKIDEFSRDRHAVMNDDDDEESNVKNNNRSNCIRCCRLSIDCCRVANIVCEKCFKQKIACISIRREFVCC